MKDSDKGNYFAEEAKTSKCLGFIEKGLFQYFININGEEKTTYSIGVNNLVASLVSFLKQVPSRENICAAVPSSAWLISKDDFNRLQQTIPSFKDYYIGVLEWQVCCIEESRIYGIMLSAVQRYEKINELIDICPVQSFLASTSLCRQKQPKKNDMKNLVTVSLFIIISCNAFSQSKLSKHEISINGFRNPSIGAE